MFLAGIYTAAGSKCIPVSTLHGCLEGASLPFRQDGREKERKGGKERKGEKKKSDRKKRKKKGKNEGRAGKERPLWKTILGEFWEASS